MAKRNRTLAERFWAKVRKTDTCWLWTGQLSPSGYGRFSVDHRKTAKQAHRIAFFLTHGRYPSGETCHTCDVRACVRPDHLYDGTRSDNVRDAVARGRHNHAKKTSCRNGHPLYENAYVYTGRGVTERQCRICATAHKRAWAEKNRDARNAARREKRRALRVGTPPVGEVQEPETGEGSTCRTGKL